jgi:HEPN domain-containing protein
MTSIKWLIEQMQNNIHHTIKIPNEYVEKALEMHKQEIIDAYDAGENNIVDCIDNKDNDKPSELTTSEQYYQETFKKD